MARTSLTQTPVSGDRQADGGSPAPGLAPRLAPPAPVILVDSDPVAGRVLMAALAGHRVTHYASIADAMTALQCTLPRLVVLGLRPGPEGRLVACAEARSVTQAPILLCAADRRELLLAFRLGADDAVQPPLDWELIRARAEALIRRGSPAFEVSPVAGRRQVGVLTIDLVRLRVAVGTSLVALTPPELRILAVLADHAGRTVSREELSRLALDQDHIAGTRSLDMHVRRLRRKVHAAAARSGAGRVTITSSRGIGYRLIPGDEAHNPAAPQVETPSTATAAMAAGAA